MILVPKIGPHGLFDSHGAGLFQQLTESASLNSRGDLVRGFRMPPDVLKCLNRLTRRDNKCSHV